jgi:hypothetical protein
MIDHCNREFRTRGSLQYLPDLSDRLVLAARDGNAPTERSVAAAAHSDAADAPDRRRTLCQRNAPDRHQVGGARNLRRSAPDEVGE